MNWVIIRFELAVGVALAVLVIGLIVWALIAVKERINAHMIQVVLAGFLVMVFSGETRHGQRIFGRQRLVDIANRLASRLSPSQRIHESI